MGKNIVPKTLIQDAKIWDKLRKCNGIDCRFASICPHRCAKIIPQPGAVCLVESHYITANLDPMLKLIDRSKDPFVMQWIGMHLVPLYLDLVQLKLEKLLLEEIVYKDGKGQIRVHPIFDEIRKTHREIFTVWKTSGLRAIADSCGFFKPPVDLSLDFGDSDSYEEMQGDFDNYDGES